LKKRKTEFENVFSFFQLWACNPGLHPNHTTRRNFCGLVFVVNFEGETNDKVLFENLRFGIQKYKQ